MNSLKSQVRQCSRLAVVTVLILLPGCSMRYTYRISVIIRDAATGQPLQDVLIDLNGYDASSGVPFPVRSNNIGEVEFDWIASDSDFMAGNPTWILNMKKSGYVKESVNISPQEEPSDYQRPVRIVVIVYLRQAKK